MPLITIKDLTTPLTPKDFEESIYATMRSLEVETTAWKPGAVARAIITATAVCLAALSRLTTALARSSFLDTAEGPWLTLTAKQTFFVDRIQATYATGEVTLTNTAGGLYLLDPEELIFRNARTNKTYVNVEPVEIQPMGPDVKVKVRAQEVGSKSNAAPGDVNELLTTLNGVTCWNHGSIIGFDEESDEELRERCRERPASLSTHGPKKAYQYWAKTAERNGVNLGVRRVKVERLSDYGEVGVTVATAEGGLPADDLAYLDKFLYEKVVPLGVRMYLQNATAKPIGITCQLWVSSSRTNAQIEAAVRTRLDSLLRDIPIGGETLAEDGPGYVFQDALIEAIRKAVPGEIVRVALDTPTGDIELGANEIPNFDVASITINRITSH